GGSWSKACRWPCQQQSNQLRIEGVLTSKKPTAVGHQHAAGLTVEINRQRLIVITQFSTFKDDPIGQVSDTPVVIYLVRTNGRVLSRSFVHRTAARGNRTNDAPAHGKGTLVSPAGIPPSQLHEIHNPRGFFSVPALRSLWG